MSLKSKQILLYVTVNLGTLISCYLKYLQGEPAKRMLWVAVIGLPFVNVILWIGFRWRRGGRHPEVLLEIFWNERELRAGWRFAAFAAIFYSLARGGIRVAASLHLPPVIGAVITPGAIFSQECVLLLVTLVATLFMGFLERRAFGVFGLPRSGAFGARFWQGAAWGIAMIAAAMLLIRLFGGFSFGDFALHGAAAWRYALIWGVVFLSVGLFEEFLFRGYAQFTLATGLGFWPAATIVSAAFGAVHTGNSGEDMAGAVGVFVVAMFFCLTLRRTGNLWFAVGVHAAFDWGETFLFSVPDSGIVAPGHLLNSSLHGPAWLTGGTVGPEGSAMAFAVVALAAVLFVIVYPAKE
jgi:uncharacterized protein